MNSDRLDFIVIDWTLKQVSVNLTSSRMRIA